jgi:hypothetical protein
MGTAYAGGDPSAGPGVAGAGGPGGQGFGGRQAAAFDGGIAGTLPLGSFGGGPGADGSLDAGMLRYLAANRGSARWLVAVSGANTAGQVELATGQPVMAMGGFTGGDDAPTLGQLQALVASGDLRFVAVGGAGGGPMGGAFGRSSSSVSAWVTSACAAVDLGNGTTTSVYDCAGAVGG